MSGSMKNWIPFLSSEAKQKHADAQLRTAKNELPPVEQLEQRLCLGSMHAGVADFAHATDQNLSPPAAVRYANSDASQRPLPVHEVPSFDHENSSREQSRRSGPSDQPFQNSSTVDSTHADNTETIDAEKISPSLTRQHPLSRQINDGLNSAINTNLNRVLSDLNLSDADVGEPQRPSATDRASAATTNPPSTTPDQPLRSANSRSAPGLSEVNFVHQNKPDRTLDSADLASLGLQLDDQGNAFGFTLSDSAQRTKFDAWWNGAEQPVVIQYDFRDVDGHTNQITEQQKQLAIQAMEAWSAATNGQIVFEQNSNAPESRIVNIGVGDMEAVGYVSGEGALLGVGGGQVSSNDESGFNTNGLAWLDQAENWDHVVGNGDPADTVDFSTVIAHEIGHALGLADNHDLTNSIMNGNYDGERSLASIQADIDRGDFERTVVDESLASTVELHPMSMALPQLQETEVRQLLARASAASASNDAIIAVVDRNGRILGVRVEADVLAAVGGDTALLVFMIDGAVAKARTAAMFSNGDPDNGTLAPITSRTIRTLSQSTITQREVESNPNDDGGSLATALASTTRGPGFVAPIGVGGHFPQEINFTPLVDLFGIEHTNRDSTQNPGADGIKGTADDIFFQERFNIDPLFVPLGQNLTAPESFGAVQNSGLLPRAQSRGIATLPGGVPLFRDTNGDGDGDTLIGGIGVFFPGADGYATFEQGFIPGIGQTETQRTNASRVLEAEAIAFIAAGGSNGAVRSGIVGAKPGVVGAIPFISPGVAPVANLDLPFGRLDLVGIQLDVFGPMGSSLGTQMVADLANSLTPGLASGADQVVDGATNALYRKGQTVPELWLVTPHDSADGTITAAEVQRIIENGITAANNVRAAIRLPLSNPTRMVLAVTDTTGEVLGLYRMQDATTFSIDVAVAKARNVAYFADANDLQALDRIGDAGTAYTNRTFRFLSQPRFPSGINGTDPAPFSILHDGNINQLNGENLGGPAPVSAFRDTTPDFTPSVYGYDSFFPNTNFRDPGDGLNPAGSPDAYHNVNDTLANQNGIVFFPGSTPIYRDGRLIGGFGVSGDGVDQDDVVTYVGATGFLPESSGILRADQTFVRDIRLPYQKFLRNPFGGLC